MMEKVLNIGTLFSGIGAFEHALDQLNIKYKIHFACDCGERELPLKYGDLSVLTNGLSDLELRNYCEQYINKIGVKVDLRDKEVQLLFDLIHKLDEHKKEAPVVLKYHKEGRKSLVEHHLVLTQDQIIKLTPNMTMKERETYVNNLYNKMGSLNHVKEVYFANYNISDKQWHEDVCFLDANEFRCKIDILVGGSPCQSFSNYGKKLGLEDIRGTLFYEYARIIKESQPKIFIYENVENVIKNDSGKTWEVMLNVWKSLGYHIEYQVLNALDFNHPQRRSRLFLIGFRDDIYREKFSFPLKKDLTSKSTDFLEPYPIDNKYYFGKKGFEWITTPDKNQRRSRVNQDIIGCETANQQDNWIGDFRVEHPEKRHLEDNRIYIGKFDFKDGLGPVDAVGRKLTPRECFNLMGFNNSFKINTIDKIAYRLSGNSIVVPVLKELTILLLPYLK